MALTTVPSQQARSLTHRRNLTRKPIALAIAASLIGIASLTGCSPSAPNTDTSTQTVTKATDAQIAPGAPGNAPTWAFSGKTGIGTSYEPYTQGQYQDSAQNRISRVWFSIAQGILTETMYGLIHNAQLKELQFVITGNGFVDTEKDNTISSIEYLDTDANGRPQSLAYKIINRDVEGKYQIEKHIFTDPDRDTLMMRVTFTAFESGITPHLYVNPHIDNAGANDIGRIDHQALIARTADPRSSVMTVKSDIDFAQATTGFVGVSDGLADLADNGKLDTLYQATSNAEKPIQGNIAFTASYPALQANQPLNVNLAIGFGQDEASSLANANASLTAGYDKVLSQYNAGWHSYLQSLPAMPDMAQSTTDNGKLLYTSAMVLKAQEDKTYAGALIASLSNPWGDTVPAVTPSTGYKAVWPRDFYQCAMAFLAMGDTQTPKVAFEYLKKVQVSDKTPGYSGTPGWFLQKTHVDGQIEWVGVQLDQTAMPIMLGWKLWQAGVLSQAELSHWYQEMLKAAADFLVSGGEVNLDWNHTQITPPKTQQERWEEQAGYSPSTTAAVIAGLVAASDIAKAVNDSDASQRYLATAKTLNQQLEKHLVTTQGLLTDSQGIKAPYYLRLSPNGEPNTAEQLAANNGRAGLDQRQILDGGFLELVRYGVRGATDKLINQSLALVDNTELEDNLRLKYNFTAKDGGSVPGFRRYGNDGYGEDTLTGANYAESGSNSDNQRGRVWPFFTGERGHFELALASAKGELSGVHAQQTKQQLINTYVQGMETFANAGLMLPEQAWDGVGNATRYQYQLGQGTNSATPLAWTHAEYIKLVRSMSDGRVWDNYPIVPEALK
ncbi:glucan 1,4-alpha-glucosidase [Shewanella xiamenensis]|uniref:glucan 1,4-alpha-glucosidase n=1 Tax=Shewanella xiamenensis TaxID=332186 RepID=UPI001C4F1876|nr:glucan 1,4-alpha-glucosidase [Shewanella xiamenensis]MBW0281351.1 glucan 1,4-alpha-glucosidase [Shewanella xiamenensis]MCT8874067.1 glucan 1,4-alpha-glucosidase [Shewanella xiamenensis]UWH40180.1 glucan 1,4-alpha-glucosidase [Shewanella xiamenensis]